MSNNHLYLIIDMQKKPRVDRRITIGKVAEEIAINPNQTVREIAKKS